MRPVEMKSKDCINNSCRPACYLYILRLLCSTLDIQHKTTNKLQPKSSYSKSIKSKFTQLQRDTQTFEQSLNYTVV